MPEFDSSPSAFERRKFALTSIFVYNVVLLRWIKFNEQQHDTVTSETVMKIDYISGLARVSLLNLQT